MNITKDIIADLYPLYAENECSADTRALVADYLARHPQEAETLRRAATTSLPVLAPSPAQLAETQSLREARRRVRRRAWWMGLALFFSLAPVLLPRGRRDILVDAAGCAGKRGDLCHPWAGAVDCLVLGTPSLEMSLNPTAQRASACGGDGNSAG